MAKGTSGSPYDQCAAQRTNLTTDLVEIYDTNILRAIITSHPRAEVHQIVTFLKSLCESEPINMIVTEMEILMVIQKGHNPLKDSNRVVTVLKADHEIDYVRNWMLETLTGMFMDRFNIKGFRVSLNFSAISIITAAL